MGVWDLRGLYDQIKKFEKLAKSKGISDSDREHFLRCSQKAREDYDRYAAQWEENIRIRKEGISMGNVANKQCPMCRSTDIEQIYVTTYSFYQCNACGERFKDE